MLDSTSVWWRSLVPGSKTHLHVAVNLTAVEHEVEEVQVVQGRLPRYVVPLSDEVLGGVEGQDCGDDLGSSKTQREHKHIDRVQLQT